MSLLSFVPRINQKHWARLIHEWSDPSDSDNLYFYRHLCKYRPASLVTDVKERYAPAQEVNNNEAHDIADQVIINSRIATIKFRMFTIAVVNILIAAGVIIVGLFIDALSHI